MTSTEELLTELITCEKKKTKILKKFNENFESGVVSFVIVIGILIIVIAISTVT